MSLDTLHELGFSEGLIAHLRNYDDSSLLGYRCQPPYYWRSSSIATRPITPLWECGTTLAYFNKESKLFEICSLESIDDVLLSHASAQAILAKLVIDLYEDGLTHEELKEAAHILGFKHIARFFVEAEANQGNSYERWSESFPTTCGG